MIKILLEWLPFVVLGMIVVFVILPMDKRQQEEKQQQEIWEAEQQALEDREREAAEAEYVNNVKEAVNSGRCHIRYTDWSICTPSNQQFREVIEMEHGCSVGDTLRACTYSYNSLFDKDMDEIMQLIIRDIEQKGGTFQFITYDQSTEGRYKNVVTLLLDQTTGRLVINRDMMDAHSNQIFSETLMYDAIGNYEPDVFYSPVISKNMFYEDVEPNIKEKHLIMWEQIMSKYLIFYLG